MTIAAPVEPPQMEALVPARRRLTASIAAALISAGSLAWFAPWQISALIAWCGGAGMFIGLAWVMVLAADSDRTRAIAMREDETRVTADLVVLLAGIASLVGVGFILVKASSAKGLALAGMTGLGVVSVVLAWAVVHTVFTFRYADLYYSGGGGIDFNEDDAPDYRDFAYLALTIGMTYQVSDTDLKTKAIRRTALKHALLSYLFGTAIIAMMINIVAGLTRQGDAPGSADEGALDRLSQIAAAPPTAVQGTVCSLQAARELPRMQALSLGRVLVRLGSDPESLFEGLQAFDSGKQIEPKIR